MESHQLSANIGSGNSSKPVQVVQPLIISPMSMMTNSSAVQVQGQAQLISNSLTNNIQQQHGLPPLSSITSSMPAVGQKSGGQTLTGQGQPPYLTQNVNIMNISFASPGSSSHVLPTSSNSLNTGSSSSLPSRQYATASHSNLATGLLHPAGTVYMQQPQQTYQQTVQTSHSVTNTSMVALAQDNISSINSTSTAAAQTITLYQLPDGTYLMGGAGDGISSTNQQQTVQMVQMAAAYPQTSQIQQFSQDTTTTGTFVLGNNGQSQPQHFLTESPSGGKVYIQQQPMGGPQLQQQVLMAMPVSAVSSMNAQGSHVIYTTSPQMQSAQPPQHQRIFLTPSPMQGQPMQTHVIQAVPMNVSPTSIVSAQKAALAPLAPRAPPRKGRGNNRTPQPNAPLDPSICQKRSRNGNRLASPKPVNTGPLTRLVNPLTTTSSPLQQTSSQILPQPVTMLRPVTQTDNRNPVGTTNRAVTYHHQSVPMSVQSSTPQPQTLLYQSNTGTQMLTFQTSPNQCNSQPTFLSCNQTATIPSQQILTLQPTFTTATPQQLLRQTGLLEQPRTGEEILQVNVQLQSRCFAILLSRPQKMSLERLLSSLSVNEQMNLLQTFVQEQVRIYGPAAPQQQQQQQQALQPLSSAPPPPPPQPQPVQSVVFATAPQIPQALPPSRPIPPVIRTPIQAAVQLSGVSTARQPVVPLSTPEVSRGMPPPLSSVSSASPNMSSNSRVRATRSGGSSSLASRSLPPALPILSPLQRLVQSDQVRCLMAGVEQLNIEPSTLKQKSPASCSNINAALSDELHTVTGTGKIEEKLLAFHVVQDVDEVDNLTKADEALKSYCDTVQERAQTAIAYLNNLLVREKHKSAMCAFEWESEMASTSGALDSDTADVECMKEAIRIMCSRSDSDMFTLYSTKESLHSTPTKTDNIQPASSNHSGNELTNFIFSNISGNMLEWVSKVNS